MISKGFSEDVAFQLDDVRRTAYCIIYQMMDGRKFDTHTMRFVDPK